MSEEDNLKVALSDFAGNLSQLTAALTDGVKEHAMRALHDTIEEAEVRIKDAVKMLSPADVIRANPKTAMATAFGVGMLLTLGRVSALSNPVFVGALSAGMELVATHFSKRLSNVGSVASHSEKSSQVH